MGFWDWWTGKPKRATSTDKIWLTRPAKLAGVRGMILEHVVRSEPLLLLAHFRAALVEIRRELDNAGVRHRLHTAVIGNKEVNRVFQETGDTVVHVGLVKQLEPDPYTQHEIETAGVCQIVVVERHLLRKYDDLVMEVAGNVRMRCQVTYCMSLDDPLVKIFAGDGVKEVLQGSLGMKDADVIESRMISRRVLVAQQRLAQKGDPDLEAESAEDWFQKFWELAKK